jgi:DNA-binding protein H-NS
MRAMNLDSMTMDDLLTLRDRVAKLLSNRVMSERRELENRLARLANVVSLETPHSGRGGPGKKRGKVAPKYRNPKNTSETWTGRGLKPRWLSAEIKAGKKLSSFEISEGASLAAVGRRKRFSKAR